MQEEAITRVGPQRQKKKNISYLAVGNSVYCKHRIVKTFPSDNQTQLCFVTATRISVMSNQLVRLITTRLCGLYY